MEQKRLTLVVSDLHMGDGKPGDDFVDDRHQFAQFVRDQAETSEGRAGAIELIINGDFLEFVQVFPQAYTLDSPDYWCSERESLEKFEHILRGHADVFASLREFQQSHNKVTLFAGNHDVDLYWPAVQARIREKAGDINIELGEVWYHRYGGRLRISHGHLLPAIDPANYFKQWANPRLKQPDDTLLPRLEMCPGTLFVVRFVNLLEEKYPFADNLHPELALACILWREKRWGLMVIGWMLARFAGQFPKAILSSDTDSDFEVGMHLLQSIQVLQRVQEEIASLYRTVLHRPDVQPDQVPDLLKSEKDVLDFVERVLRAGDSWDKLAAVLDLTKPQVLGDASNRRTLEIGRAGMIDVRQKCLEEAGKQWRAGAEIVIIGHTHLKQRIVERGQCYYNPGSWTRYVDAGDADGLKLKDLQREEFFPYELNYVRVERTNNDELLSELVCFESAKPCELDPR